MKEIICQECGAENPVGYLLCKKCGAKLHSSIEELKEQPVRDIIVDGPEPVIYGERKERKPLFRNPAIPWMILGFILVVVGLGVVILASAWTPDIYHPDMTEEESLKAYANELEEKATYIFYGGMIEFVGFLIFMISTIYGVSWNVKRLHVHE